ncbi:hypothetical protein IFM89_004487 [Coptis chinensis]|uniref:Uncharacterized protein n=1 Tax=Coptis chinensis TaxID=261450 RepID=A0A835GW92_9MAGN|nr:hypothetical protein IFM89_004487 [Coptis chinensis]
MPMALKCLYAVLFLTLLGQGLCQCSLRNIKVTQNRTGRDVKGKVEHEVTIINDCKCMQKLIEFNCSGFSSAIVIDPSIFSKIGDICQLKGGGHLNGYTSIKFRYAWDTTFNFIPATSQIVC